MTTKRGKKPLPPKTEDLKGVYPVYDDSGNIIRTVSYEQKQHLLKKKIPSRRHTQQKNIRLKAEHASGLKEGGRVGLLQGGKPKLATRGWK